VPIARSLSESSGRPHFSQFVSRSLTAWIRPGSYADLATRFTTSRGHFNTDIGMTTRSALITRKQLNAYEEARAVQAMLDRGLTEDGAAQALGWPKNRVTARVRILELPVRAQQLIGEHVIHLAAVDQLRAIGKVAPDLFDAVIAYLDDGNAWPPSD
jgi:hypothetical protein